MEPSTLRDDMVASLEHEMKGLVRSEYVGLALRAVPRHEFVPLEAHEGAYTDQSFDHRGRKYCPRVPSPNYWKLSTFDRRIRSSSSALASATRPPCWRKSSAKRTSTRWTS